MKNKNKKHYDIGVLTFLFNSGILISLSDGLTQSFTSLLTSGELVPLLSINIISTLLAVLLANKTISGTLAIIIGFVNLVIVVF